MHHVVFFPHTPCVTISACNSSLLLIYHQISNLTQSYPRSLALSTQHMSRAINASNLNMQQEPANGTDSDSNPDDWSLSLPVPLVNLFVLISVKFSLFTVVFLFRLFWKHDCFNVSLYLDMHREKRYSQT